MSWAALALVWTLIGGSLLPPESIIPPNAQQAARYYQQTADALASWRAPEAAIRNYEKALQKDPQLHTARLHLAATMAGAGMMVPAMQQVEVVLKAKPQDREANLLYSRMVLFTGKPRDAELAVRPVVERDGQDAEARRILGITLLAQDQPDKAAEQFKLATRAKPDDAESYKLLAEAQLKQKQYAAAVVTLQKYLTLRPGDLQISMQMMLPLLLQLGRKAEALALGLNLLKQYPDNVPMMMGLAGELIKAGRRDEAMALYRQALKLAKQAEIRLVAANALAEYAASKQRFREAAGYLRQVIAIKPELVPPRMMLVRMCMLASDWSAAAGAVRALAAMNPDNLGFRMQLFDLQLRAGQSGAAAQTAFATMRRWPNDPGVAQTLAGGLVRAGQANRALTLLSQARQRFPDLRPLGYLLYQLQRTLGRDAAAEGLLEALLKQWPDDPLVRHELAGAAFDQQEYQRVVDLLEPLLRRRQIAPDAIFALAWSLEKIERYIDAAGLYQGYAMSRNQPTLLLNVARQFEAVGDFDSEIRIARKVLDSAPQHVPAMIVLGRALGNAKQIPEAVAIFEQVVTLQPDNAVAWRSLAVAYQELDQPLAAEAAYRRLAQVDPENDYAVALVGRMQAAMQARDQAIDTWLAGLQKHPDSAVLHRVLADAYRAQDDYPEAIAHYTAAVEADPHDFATLLAGAVANEHLDLFGEARAWYRKIQAAGPETSYIYRRWLETFERERTPELGLQAGLQLLSQRPGSDLLADAVMQQATRTGQLALLGQSLDRLLPTQPHVPGWQDLQGRRLLADGDLAGAAGWYGDLSRAQPMTSRWRLRSGEVAAAAGDLTKARREFEASSRLAPHDPEPLRGLAETELAAGREDDAMMTLRKLMALAPEDPEGFERLVRLYAGQGRIEVVRDGLRELIFAPPPKGKSVYRNSSAVMTAYGLACELAGQPSEAADAYRKSLEMNAHQLTARMGLQRVMGKLKNPQRLGPAR